MTATISIHDMNQEAEVAGERLVARPLQDPSNGAPFAQEILFRGASLDVVWPGLVTVAGLGSVFFFVGPMLFQRSIPSDSEFTDY